MAKTDDELTESQRLQAAAVAAQEARDAIQPTPTQEEADKAKLGKLEDGFAAPDEPAELTQKAESAEKPTTYKTRAAKAD
jgi:hypothetical protein